MKGVLCFLAGAGIGSAITFFALRDTYRKYAQEEIDSVKEVYKKKEPVKEEPVVKPPKQTEFIRSSLDKAKDIAEASGYANYREATRVPNVEDLKNDSPYVISPEEFGDNEDYLRVTLYYYADEVLTDENNEVVNPKDCVGLESLTHFGEYEDDSVHVRNDAKQCDYEILMDHRKYEDIYHV